MSTRLPTVILPALFCAALFGCEGDSSAIPIPAQACATPGDLEAPADVTITAQDAVLDVGGDQPFYAWTYDGDVPGPVLRMEVGETRRIKLVNDSPRPASLHFHGVHYAAEDDGTPNSPKSVVQPGCAHVYEVRAQVPGVWPFHSHISSRIELSRGLYGAVIVPDPNEAPADREYVVFLGQLGMENADAENEEEGAGGEPFFMTINGRPHAMAEVIERSGSHYTALGGDGVQATARVGERVRFRVLNVSPDDSHTFHIHAHRWCTNAASPAAGGTCPAGSVPEDNTALLPAQGFSMDFVEDNPGDWLYHCHIIDHMKDGMYAMYHVDE